jgi:hypothetical protein
MGLTDGVIPEKRQHRQVPFSTGFFTGTHQRTRRVVVLIAKSIS